mgnify:CR=1 FL=1
MDGKSDWMAYGLPVEGADGPFLGGELAEVPTCDAGGTVADARAALGDAEAVIIVAAGARRDMRQLEAAVREILEETGFHVRVGRPLGVTRYAKQTLTGSRPTVLPGASPRPFPCLAPCAALAAHRAGDGQALDRAFSFVYDDLRRRIVNLELPPDATLYCEAPPGRRERPGGPVPGFFETGRDGGGDGATGGAGGESGAVTASGTGGA